MAWNLRNRLATAGTRFDELAGEDAVYRRGATEKNPVSVHPCQGEDEVFIPGVAQTLVDRHRFFLNVADLEELTVPEHGDQIDWNGKTFQVVGEGDEPPFSYITSNRTRVMVSTEVVGTI